MATENLINSAVTFLRDPSVQSASLDSKVSFLESKGLSKEDIDVALERANGQYRPTTHADQGLTAHGRISYYERPPVPERDWRDWFIMAVVSGGFSYALYTLGKRYILPAIKPPTPAALEQDKLELANEMEQARSLLERLDQETSELRTTQQEQTKLVEEAITELSTTLDQMKSDHTQREKQMERAIQDIETMRLHGLPRALESYKQGEVEALKSLENELKSLKNLVLSRQSGDSRPSISTTNGSGDAAGLTSSQNESSASDSQGPQGGKAAGGFFNLNGRGGIPEWQKAANNSGDSSPSANNDQQRD